MLIGKETAAELLTKERIPNLSELELRGFLEQLDAMQYFFKFDDLIAGAGVEGLRSALRTLITRAEDGTLGSNLKRAFPVVGHGAGPGLISQIINARFPERYWVYSRDTTPKHLRHLGLKPPGDLSAISYAAAGPYMQQVQQSLVLAGIESADYLTVDQFLWWAYWGQQTEPQAWLFPANADHYQSVAQLHSARPGSESTSAIRRAARAPRPPHNGKEPHEGDVAVLWQTGKSEGIVAAGLIISEPVNEVANLRYTHVLEQCITSTELRRNPVLTSLEVLTTSNPPSFPLTSDQWKEIKKLMILSSNALHGNSTNVLATSLAQQGLHFTPWQIATYYTALQTKGFAILSGISGTGKTKLAQHFAEMLPQPWTPVLTPSDGVLTVTLQPYMVKYRRMTKPVRAFKLFNPPPPGEHLIIPVKVGDQCQECRLSSVASGNNHWVELLFRAPIVQWLNANLSVGDSFVIDPELDESQNLSALRLMTANEQAEESKVEGRHGDNLLFVPVRPDWRDSKSLLGYYNPLTSTYEWTDFLRFLQRVERDYKDGDGSAWFVILDEMNLAHVEYYFADLLSVLESGRYEDGEMQGLTREPLRLAYPEDAEGDLPPRELRLPPNLYVVGTVNVDETTRAFSPKVLDRAFTLEFTDVDFAAYPPQLNGTAQATDADTSRQLLTAFTQDGTFERVDKGTIAAFVADHPEVRDRLQSLNNLLKPHDVHFGYRVFDEIVTFLSAAERNKTFKDEEGEYPALDAAVLMKVLPKFHGSRGKLEAPLRAVLAWCLNPEIPDPLQIDGALKNVEDANHATASLNGLPFAHPRTSARTIRMLRALYTDGFAAFG